jgi:hypothetical protein
VRLGVYPKLQAQPRSAAVLAASVGMVEHGRSR